MHSKESTPSLVVTVASHQPRAVCRECGGPLPTRHMNDSDLEDHVNHYLAHGWRLLHVGQETRSVAGTVEHATVAVLGRPSGLEGDPTGQEEPGELTVEGLAGGALRSLLEDLDARERESSPRGIERPGGPPDDF